MISLANVKKKGEKSKAFFIHTSNFQRRARQKRRRGEKPELGEPPIQPIRVRTDEIEKRKIKKRETVCLQRKPCGNRKEWGGGGGKKGGVDLGNIAPEEGKRKEKRIKHDASPIHL